MSYILDALKKAERQRDIGQVPGIGSEHQSTITARPNRWAFVLLFVLIINAGLLVYTLWPTSVVPTRAVSASSTATRAVPTPRAGENPPAVLPGPEKPAAAPVTKRPPPAVVTAPPMTLRPLPPPLPEPAKAVLVETPGITDSGADSAESRGTASAPVVTAAAAGSSGNLPVWPQVSAQLFREINGSLRMDVHVYSEHPLERFVLINLRKYNEGEQLQEGPVVDEITPEGVILSFHGQRFRVQAQ